MGWHQEIEKKIINDFYGFEILFTPYIISHTILTKHLKDKGIKLFQGERLGIYLTNTYEYSEYIVLKKVKLFGFLERTENIISMSFITHSYIYLTLIIYTISKNIKPLNNRTFKIANIIISIFLIIAIKLIFTNITVFNNFTSKTFIYIISLLIIIYIIIFLKIAFNKKKVKLH